MPEEILVPMDSSAQAEAALEYAIETHPGAEITVLHAYGIEDASVSRGAVIVLEDEVREAAKEHAETVFEQARDVAAATGYEGEIGTVAKEGSPERVIPDYAAETDVDAIVIGGHGRENPTRVLLGSVAETVVRRSPVPVTVVK